jgi:hypothetical protein
LPAWILTICTIHAKDALLEAAQSSPQGGAARALPHRLWRCLIRAGCCMGRRLPRVGGSGCMPAGCGSLRQPPAQKRIGAGFDGRAGLVARFAGVAPADRSLTRLRTKRRRNRGVRQLCRIVAAAVLLLPVAHAAEQVCIPCCCSVSERRRGQESRRGRHGTLLRLLLRQAAGRGQRGWTHKTPHRLLPCTHRPRFRRPAGPARRRERLLRGPASGACPAEEGAI